MTWVDQREESRRLLMRWVALAASLLALLGFGVYYARSEHLLGNTPYITRAGETRTVIFREGSVAYLNTRTEVRWIGNEIDRRVQLSAGEALFDVAPDPQRPFWVMLGDSEIRVLATRFNVYRKADGSTTITVLEGTVEVRGFTSNDDRRLVSMGEQLEYRPATPLPEPRKADTERAVSWRERNIELPKDGMPLSQIVDELKRYTDRRIEIRDPSMAQRRIGGVLKLPTDDVRGALDRLKTVVPLEWTEDGSTFVIESTG